MACTSSRPLDEAEREAKGMGKHAKIKLRGDRRNQDAGVVSASLMLWICTLLAGFYSSLV